MPKPDTSDLLILDNRMTIKDVSRLGDSSRNVVNEVRNSMFQPHKRKLPPTYGVSDLARLCNCSKEIIYYTIRDPNSILPKGTKDAVTGKIRFSLGESIQWVHSVGSYTKRPEHKRGRIITVGNFKGGVTKTTTAVSLAQALTLMGRKVLLVDCDSQGTATQLCGWLPNVEIRKEHTLLPFLAGDESNLSYAIKSTYWDELDLIPACSLLSEAELKLSRRFSIEDELSVEILRNGLLPLAEQSYDVVLLDTPPALGYLTMNAAVAADGLLVPCPIGMLDFVATTDFWYLFSDIEGYFPDLAKKKRYDFVQVLLTKVEANDFSKIIRTWFEGAYGKNLLSTEIPESAVAKRASTALATVHDLRKSDFASQAYNRYKDPLDQLAAFVNEQLITAWAREE